MPLWPFKRRRHSTSRDVSQRLLSEKAQAATSSPPTATSARRASQTSKDPWKRDSQRPDSPPAVPEKDEKMETAEWIDENLHTHEDIEKLEQLDPEKENRPVPLTQQAQENITALPMSEPLESSPHLRPVDLEKPAIPYNFRAFSGSQTSFQRQDVEKKNTSRPATLRSKRSAADRTSLKRKTSSKARKRDDRLREEEIRAMSAAMPIPRHGSSTPLRQESRKLRERAGLRESTVSLPPEGSIHSSMSGILEQRGWEIGTLAALNPRPNIRLSGAPQYVAPNAVPVPPAAGGLYRIDSIRAKDKRPVTRGSVKTGKSAKSGKKRERVGDQADSLDAGNIRAIMDRESKRKEQRQRERQEKIDRKLRSRAGRERKDGDRRRRDADDARARAEQELRSRAPLTPPTDIHPAFRNREAETGEGDGLGLLPPSPRRIDTTLASSTMDAVSSQQVEPVSPIDESNPFADANTDDKSEHAVSPVEETFPETPGATSHYDTQMETPLEDAVVGTAQAVRMAYANTPPLSPVYSRGAGVSQFTKITAQRDDSRSGTPAPSEPTERREAEGASSGRKSSAWAMLFRRGGTSSRNREKEVDRASMSFSNTSRESMRNKPLPAHLVESEPRFPSASRSLSGPHGYSQSKFREDLPETPLSPPDSRAQSPDVAIATTTSMRRANTPQPIDIPRAVSSASASRSAAPSSPPRRGHVVSSSLASVDSEGSWLASGSLKRQSNTSALSRSYSKRTTEFTASYEELGSGSGDKDAEYFQGVRKGSASARGKAGTSALAGATPDEAMEIAAEGQAAGAGPMTVHETAERQPVLVHRDPRVRSREGLLADYTDITPAAETPNPLSQELLLPEHEVERAESTSASEYFDAEDNQASDEESASTDDSPSPAEEPQLQSATSVRYAGRHSRQFSAGSARLLDVQPRLMSTDTSGEGNETPRATERPSSPRQSFF